MKKIFSLEKPSAGHCDNTPTPTPLPFANFSTTTASTFHRSRFAKRPNDSEPNPGLQPPINLQLSDRRIVLHPRIIVRNPGAVVEQTSGRHAKPPVDGDLQLQ